LEDEQLDPIPNAQPVQGTIMVSLLERILSMMRLWSVLGKESMFMVMVLDEHRTKATVKIERKMTRTCWFCCGRIVEGAPTKFEMIASYIEYLCLLKGKLPLNYGVGWTTINSTSTSHRIVMR
jgi:hypothetical protein